LRKSNFIGRDLERRLAKKVSGRTTIASGSLWFCKEDVEGGGDFSNWLFQCKATDKYFFSLKVSDIKKLISNADKKKNIWGFAIEFSSSEALERAIYVILPVNLISKLPEKFKSYGVNVPVIKNKQAKITREDLDDCWLNDKFYLIKFKDLDVGLFAMNELDFVSAFKKN
jgi:hypothetical protein